jgi:hypothetical protein
MITATLSITCPHCGFKWVTEGDDRFHVEAYHNKNLEEYKNHKCVSVGRKMNRSKSTW